MMEIIIGIFGVLVAAVGILLGRLRHEVNEKQRIVVEREIALAQLKHGKRMGDVVDVAQTETERRLQQVEKEITEGRRDHFESDK